MQQAMVQRQKQLMHLQQQQQQQQLQNKMQPPESTSEITSNTKVPDTSVPAVSSGATGPQSSPSGGSSSFWNGAIMWTVAMPGNKRNQAVTFVSAHCAPNTSKDTLMLPWQQRLNISEVQSITLSALQSYAAKNSTPCILFQPLNVPMPNRPSNSGGSTPAPQQTNEAMYVMLAKMIDSKKSCAFIPLQGVNCTSEAGMVLVPTATQAGSSTKRLLGLIFRQSVPWHLFGASTAAGQTQGSVAQAPQQQPQQLLQPPPMPRTSFTPATAGSNPGAQIPLPSNNTPLQQAALFQPQQQMNQMNQMTNSSLAPASFNPQLPAWAQQSATQVPQSASPVKFPSVPLQSNSAAPSNNLEFDLQSLSNQFNFNASVPPPQLLQQTQQSQPQAQQQPVPNFNPAMLNNLWAMQGNSSDQSQQSSTGQQPAPLDLDALQRLLGLNQS